MAGNFYEKSHVYNLKLLKDLVPEQLKAWRDFSSAVMKDGALSLKEKEIIAVTIATLLNAPIASITIPNRRKSKVSHSLN